MLVGRTYLITARGPVIRTLGLKLVYEASTCQGSTWNVRPHNTKHPTSFFCMWLSSYPRTICWKASSFPAEESWQLHQKLVNSSMQRLICRLSTLFHSSLCLSLFHYKSWFTLLCSIFGNQKVWVLLPFFFFFFFRVVWLKSKYSFGGNIRIL